MLNGRETMNKVELLAPAGSFEAMKAAVESGADAVYIGGSKFNARAFADNLNEDKLKEAVEYAHLRGVRVYVTVNILILQNELKEVLEYINYLYSIDVDAIIVQDIGLASAIQELMPDFEVHCSTQMAIHNTDGASLMMEQGIKRVVLARELSLKEIDSVVQNTGIHAEIFVHGALCVCYSGQCYMSSLIGGRSGNRGKCAQPCRKKYQLYDYDTGNIVGPKEGTYLISTKDLNTYQNLYSIAESKVASLKIEGRMKRPEYVAIIVHNYKQALECIQQSKDNCLSKQAEYELQIAFNREFTQGYLFDRRNQEIVSTDRPDNRGIYIGKALGQQANMLELLIDDNFLNDGDSLEIIDKRGHSTGTTVSGIKKGNQTVKTAYKGDQVKIFFKERVSPGSIVNKTIDNVLFQKAREEYAYENKRKTRLRGRFCASLGENPVLHVWDDRENHISIQGEEVVQAAERAALTKDKVAEQLQKTKDTHYEFENLDIVIQEGSFLSLKAINHMRRTALEQLSQKRVRLNQRTVKSIDVQQVVQPANKKSPLGRIEVIAGVRSLDAAKSALEAGADQIYILGDYHYKENFQLIMDLKKYYNNNRVYYVLPQITRDAEQSHTEKMLQELQAASGPIGLVLSNLGQIPLANRIQPHSLRGNFTLNAVNSLTVDYLRRKGIQSICISPELNINQIKELHENCSIDMEALVYGYIPAMVTEYCPSSAAGDCSSCGGQCRQNYGIMDDRQKLFRTIHMGSCKTMILNSDILCVYDNLSNVMEAGANRIRLDFYHEEAREINEIVRVFGEKVNNSSEKINTGIIDQIKQKGFTKGHYFRGID